MADEQTPSSSHGDDGSPPPNAGQGWTAVAYLIGGIGVWGLIGWLVDSWLDTGGIAIGIGAILGAAGGVYLIVRRMAT